MLITLLHALTGALLAAWLALHAGWQPGLGLALSCLVAAALLAALGRWLAARALPAEPGRLRWDGQRWLLAGAQDLALQRVVVALDLGLWMLLRLHAAPDAPPQWRVAGARGAQAAWHGLRLALAAHAGTVADGEAPA